MYICGGEDGTNGCYLAGFSKDIPTLCLPAHPTLPSYRSATGIGYASKKNYLKQWEIHDQLAIQPIVGG